MSLAFTLLESVQVKKKTNNNKDTEKTQIPTKNCFVTVTADLL